MTEVKKAPRKHAVRLYESQHEQVKILGQLGADPGHIVSVFNVSDTTARDSMDGKISISPGRRDISGGVVFDQDEVQVRKVLRLGELLSFQHPDRTPFLLQLKAVTEKPRRKFNALLDDDEVTYGDARTVGIAPEPPQPEPAPEPEAVPEPVAELVPATDTPIFATLVRERLEAHIRAVAKEAAREAVFEALEEWTRP